MQTSNSPAITNHRFSGRPDLTEADRAHEESTDGEPEIRLGQVMRVIAGLGLLSLMASERTLHLSTPSGSALVIGLAVSGVIVIAVAFLPVSAQRLRLVDFALLIVMLIASASALYAIDGHPPLYATYGTAPYGMAGAAMGQAAAEIAVQGRSPYGRGLTLPLAYYGAPTPGVPPRQLSTPALSFLIYAPGVLLGFQSSVPVYATTVCLVLAMLALWLVLPSSMRSSLPFVVWLAMFFVLPEPELAVILPLLLAALWRWDRFGEPHASPLLRWLGPIALGLACSVSQAAWLLAPLLLIGVTIEARLRRLRAVRNATLYAGLSLGTFLTVNGAFIAASPRLWLARVAAPFFGEPSLRGVVALGLVCTLGLGLLLTATYRASKRLLPIFWLPSLFAVNLPFEDAVLFAVLCLLVTCATSDAPPFQPRAQWLGKWRRPVLAAALASLVLGLLVRGGSAFAGQARPLSLTVTDEHAAGPLQRADTIMVTVTNRGQKTIAPQFAVSPSPTADEVWVIHSGPTELEPNQQADYEIWAPSVDAMPRINQGFSVYAFTPGLTPLGSSAPWQPPRYGTRLIPQAVDQPVPLGQDAILKAQLVDASGREIHESGLAVYLGQTIYAQDGPVAQAAPAGAEPTGMNPVVAYTDSRGVATFSVNDATAQALETSYQAWLMQGASPYGYSQAVSVLHEQP